MHDSAGTGDICRCCGGEFRAHDMAICSICGLPFHLALRIDVPAPDCGQAWISEDVQALEFGCNACLQAAGDALPAADLLSDGPLEPHSPKRE